MKARLLIIIFLFTTGVVSAAAQTRGSDLKASGETKIGKSGRLSVVGAMCNVQVTGVDGDTVGYSATDENGQPVSVVSAGFAETDSHLTLKLVPAGRTGRSSITVKIQVPRSATIESVSVDRGNATIEQIDGAVRVTVRRGDIRVRDVGSATVQAESGEVDVAKVAGNAFVSSLSGSIRVDTTGGDVTCRSQSGDSVIANTKGIVEIYATSGSVTVQNAAADVLVKSISGDTNLTQTDGQVKVSTASGNISIANAGNDIEASAASGDITVRGPLIDRRRYFLKSLSGDVTMLVDGETSGFRVILTSYSGSIETDYPIVVDQPTQVTRRLAGKYGDGAVQIQMEAFSGNVRLLDGKKHDAARND